MSRPEPASTKPSLPSRAAREQAHFDALAVEQTDAWWGHAAPAGAVRSQRRARMVVRAAAVEPGHRLLEVGCGAGFFTANYIDLLGPEVRVTAVDISEGLLGHARTKPELADRANLALERRNVEDLPYADAAFDAVIGSSILHHLDLDAAGRELLRVLAPGGRFVFAEPNRLNPICLIRRLLGKPHDPQASPDEGPLDAGEVAAHLRRIGYVVDRVQPFDFLHPATPRAVHWLAMPICRVLEAIPLIRHAAGSLLIVARRPAPGADAGG